MKLGTTPRNGGKEKGMGTEWKVYGLADPTWNLSGGNKVNH